MKRWGTMVIKILVLLLVLAVAAWGTLALQFQLSAGLGRWLALAGWIAVAILSLYALSKDKNWLFVPQALGFLVLALVIAVAVVLVRWLAGPGHVAAHQMQARAPLDILKERFARGEIDKDEFDERRRVLGD